MYIEKETIMDLFLDLVKIDSPSGREENVAEYIVEKLKDLQIEYKADDYGNILAFLAGSGQPLMLAAHMDTVQGETCIDPIVEGDLITSGGQTILGADDKAGIAEILCALEYLKKNSVIHRPLEIVFTKEEEIGMFGAQHLDRKYITAKEGLVVDRSGLPQVAVVAAPFIVTIDIEIMGKSAHAGSPEHGLSAIKMAAEAISKLKIGRIDSETTNNIGIIHGGEIRNGVPEKVLIKAEIRSHFKAKAEKQISVMRAGFEKAVSKHGGSLKFSAEFACSGYKHQLSTPLLKNIKKTWQKMGFEVLFEKAGGASDANEFAQRGMTVVDIGYGALYPHTVREQIKISDMQLVSQFLINFVCG